jgi:hypothetical protein
MIPIVLFGQMMMERPGTKFLRWIQGNGECLLTKKMGAGCIGYLRFGKISLSLKIGGLFMKYPEYVYKAVCQRLEMTAEKVDELHSEEVFDALVAWELGYSEWADTIKDWIKDIYDIGLSSQGNREEGR